MIWGLIKVWPLTLDEELSRAECPYCAWGCFADLSGKDLWGIVASAGYSRRKLLDRMIAAQALGNLGHLQPG